jgi:uncharacterized membrane protein YagU involved in acid resistance
MAATLRVVSALFPLLPSFLCGEHLVGAGFAEVIVPTGFAITPVKPMVDTMDATRNPRNDGLGAACAGALAGLIATVPMTAAMVAIYRQLPRQQRNRQLPPEQITLALAKSVEIDDDLSRTGEKVLTGAGHFGYGAACGAVYGLYADRIQTASLKEGATFGLGVWAASYLGWLPAMGVRRSATKELAGTNIMMIAAHLVWGASTAIAYKALRQKSK